MVAALLTACNGSRPAPDVAPNAVQGTDTSIVARALDTTRFRWRRVETPRATLFIAPSAPPTAVAQAADSIEAVITAHLAWLGAKEMGPKLRLFFVSTRDEMEPITGSRAPGISETGAGAAFFALTDGARVGLRHEVMHLLSWRHWGTPSAFWISEGVGTRSVPMCGGLRTELVVPMLDRAGMLIPLETLRTNFTFAGDTGFVFYLQAASLVHFIETKYGRDKLRTVWSKGGLANVRETLGVDLTTLERDWRAAVAATPSAPTWPGWPAWRAELNKFGCS